MYSWLFLLRVALIPGIFFLFFSDGAAARALDRTVIKINEDVLTESDLARTVGELSGSLGPPPSDAVSRATSEVLVALLDKTLLQQAARRSKIEAPETEMQEQVEEMVQQIRAGFNSEADFRRALANEQLSVEDLKRQLLKRARTDFQVYRLVSSRFSITDQEVKAYEEELAAKGESPLSLRLRRLAIAVKNGTKQVAIQEARRVTEQIYTEGMTFEEGVRRYSQAPGATEDGGDLGYLSLTKLDNRVAEALKDLRPGQASEPIVTGNFANVFYVEGRRAARSYLLEKRFAEAKAAMVGELRRKANIQVLDPRLNHLLPPDYSPRVADAAATQSQNYSPYPASEKEKPKGLFGRFLRR